MSIISECLRQILSARFGKDVRQSIHDGIKELDEVARTAQGSATLSAQTAIEKANEALTASQAAIESAQQAKAYSDNAQAVAGVQVATQDNAGLVKGGENHIGLDGTLELVVKTTEASMPNSRKGRLAVDEIGGVCVQDNIPSPEYPQEIKKSVISEIKTRKNNMFDVSKFVTNQYISGDGSVSANGAWGASDYMLAKVPSITFSHKDDVWLQIVIAEYDGKKNFIQATSKQGFLPAVTQELSENTSYIRISYSIDVGNGAVTREEVMVNEGTTALPYEPYTESVITLSQPIELYGIGDVQDTIEDGEIVRRFASVVFDGSDDEGWFYDAGFNRIYTTIFQNKIKRPTNDMAANMLCSALAVKPFSVVYQGTDGICTNTNGTISAKHSSLTSLSDWKAHLASKPMTVVYELATPTTEALPITDQIALNSLSTYDGITYLEFVSDVQPTFAGKYGASLVGGIALEALQAVKGNCFTFAEHGLTFTGLKVGKMVTVHVSGALDYEITEENKNTLYTSVIPEGFRPILTTHASCIGITHKDAEGNKITDMFDVGIGGSGVIRVQVELKNDAGQSITVSKTGMPLNMAISYISE